MNYFEFYGLKTCFNIDLKLLKKAFLLKSREVHPDFHTLEDQATRDKILKMSSYNNDAYKTLSDFDSRYRYVLSLNDIHFVEGKDQIDQEFLMEMMELNEELMEAKFDENEENSNEIDKKIQKLEKTLLSGIKSRVALFDSGDDKGCLLEIKSYLLKKRYLDRLSKNLT